MSRADLPVKVLMRLSFQFRALALAVEDFGWRLGLKVRFLQMRGKTSERVLSIAGSPPLVARLGQRETDLATLRHVWRDRCYELPTPEVLGFIIDAGANVGYAACWFASRYPTATVFAVEPDEANLDLLSRNVSAFPTVVIVAAALSAHSGEQPMFDVGLPDSFRVGDEHDGEPMGLVRCVSIPDLIEMSPMSRIDLLKLDIEGSERDLLLGCADWIDKVDVVVAELHDRFLPGCTRAFVQATSGFSTEFQRGENWFAIRAST